MEHTATEIARRVRQSPPHAAGAARPRLLLAEDDDALRALLFEQLTKAGFEVTPCATGVDLLLHLAPLVLDERGLPFDLIVTDLRMPGLTGFEVLEGLPRRDFPPTVLITAFSDPECQRRARHMRGVTLLDKPFEMAALLDLVREIDLVRQAAQPRAHGVEGLGPSSER